LFIFTSVSFALTIADDIAGGGDCSLIGTWNPATLTCTPLM